MQIAGFQYLGTLVARSVGRSLGFGWHFCVGWLHNCWKASTGVCVFIIVRQKERMRVSGDVEKDSHTAGWQDGKTLPRANQLCWGSRVNWRQLLTKELQLQYDALMQAVFKLYFVHLLATHYFRLVLTNVIF